MTEENKKTLKEICWDRDRFPLEILDTYGENIKGKDHYTSTIKKPRIVTLEITSYIGISGGASHYYGKLISYCPTIHPNGEPHIGCTGYLGKEDNEIFKNIINDIRIDIAYYTSDKDVQTDELYPDIKLSTRFKTKEKLIEVAKYIFNNRFIGDWKFEIKDRT